MLKISDILKKNKKNIKKKSASSKKKVSSESVSKEDAPVKESVKPAKKEKEVVVEKPVLEDSAASSAEPVEVDINDNKDVINTYKEAIALTEEISDLDSENWNSFEKKANKIINSIIGYLETDSDTLLRLFYREYYNYNGNLYQHAVNVCILSLYICSVLQYDRKQLEQIALAALLHDIGLIKYEDLISQNKKFDSDDYAQIKKHPETGRSIIEKIGTNISKDIIEAVEQEHERLDGSGYPNGLETKDINEKAKLIGLVDSYESMLHPRPYRNKYRSEDVVKFFTKHKEKFEYKFLKTLIDLVGIFPVSSKVKLNTREIGTVIKQNYQMPFKPVVQITHNSQGKEIESPKAVDLSSNFSIYIQECLNSHKKTEEKNSE